VETVRGKRGKERTRTLPTNEKKLKKPARRKRKNRQTKRKRAQTGIKDWDRVFLGGNEERAGGGGRV